MALSVLDVTPGPATHPQQEYIKTFLDIIQLFHTCRLRWCRAHQSARWNLETEPRCYSEGRQDKKSMVRWSITHAVTQFTQIVLTTRSFIRQVWSGHSWTRKLFHKLLFTTDRLGKILPSCCLKELIFFSFIGQLIVRKMKEEWDGASCNKGSWLESNH